MNKRTTKANANTAIAMYNTMLTSAICVLAVTVPINAPTKIGVKVPVKELSVPTDKVKFGYHGFPPPPSRLSIGFTTVLRIHTEKPAMNAPNR